MSLYKTESFLNSLCLIFLVLVLMYATKGHAEGLSEELETQVDHLLQKSQANGRFAGLSILLMDSSGKKWIRHYGFRDIEQQIPPDDHTIYELGSITKTFTRLLLANQSDIKLSDPISSYLPNGVQDPKPAGQEIHFQDLALHTGIRLGTPCVPVGIDMEHATLKCYGIDQDPTSVDPWKNVTQNDLFQFINANSTAFIQFPQFFAAPGLYYEYSNTGMALLGDLIAGHHGTTYEHLLRKVILRPLRMHETYFQMPCEYDGSCLNLAKVYRNTADGKNWAPSSYWHLSAGIPAAGALRSSISDMAHYLRLEMGLLKKSRLNPAVAISQTELPDAEKTLLSNICQAGDPAWKPCNKSVSPQFEGWPSDAGKKVFFHAGETGSSQSMILFSQDREIGMVLLSNSVPGTGSSDSAEHIPNDLSLCISQLAGIYPSSYKLCDKFN